MIQRYVLGLILICLLAINSYGAMDFEVDNNGERVTFANVDLSSYNTASFCIWVIRESASTDARVFSNSWDTGYDQNWCLIIEGDADPSQIEGRLRTSTGQTIINEANIVYNGILHFICMTYDGSNVRLYVDGNLVQTEARTGNITNTDSPLTCMATDGAQIGDRDFDGIIEDYRIYNRALSQAEITTMYYGRGIDNIYYGLLHRWHLNGEAPGVDAVGSNTVKDIVGQNHGTPYLTPVYIESQLRFRRPLK